MKHCKSGRQFGRVASQRKALLSSMLVSLIIHERIETTEAKAKELKSKIDRVITKAKRAEGKDMEIVRKLEATLPIVAIQKIKDELLDRMSKRKSGYTRVIKMSPRKSDGARKAIIEFVDAKKEVKKTIKVDKKTKKSVSEKK
ncbi:MAG: 50S ribosomal protein L17 [Candidatus Moranbacteria bacterium]|nr:50S ribosomal protein L17 [Candidatus Moranbacteria bacterium]